MKLSREVNIFIACGMIVMGVLFAGITIYSMFQNNQKEMTHLSALLESERKIKLKDLVKGAYSVLNTANFYEPAQSALSDMAFGENDQNYFTVVDTDGMVWVNPFKSEQIGKIKIDEQDADGKFYIREMINNALADKEGYLTYKEIPKGQDSPVTRMVYFKYFEKWNWIVCAGMYMDDIETLLTQKKAEIIKEMQGQLGLILGLLTIMVLLSIKIGTGFLSKRVVKPLEHITQAAQKIGHGDLSTVIKVNSSREINLLADSLKKMQLSLDMAIKRARRVKQIRKERVPEADSVFLETVPVQNLYDIQVVQS